MQSHLSSGCSHYRSSILTWVIWPWRHSCHTTGAPTPQIMSPWAPLSLFLGSDGPHQADPSHGDPPHFTVLWLLILQFFKTRLKLHFFFMKPNNLGIKIYQLLEHDFMIPWYQLWSVMNKNYIINYSVL